MTSNIVENFTNAWKTYKSCLKDTLRKFRELLDLFRETTVDDIEDLSYPELMIHATLSGIDIKATDILYIDLHTYSVSGYEIPLRMKKLDDVALMSVNNDIDFMFIMLLIDLSRIPSDFKRISKIVNAIDNANPVLVVKLIKDNIDKIVDLCIWSQSHLFLSWLEKRTEVKAQYSPSIMNFYSTLSKKLNECRNTMSLLR